MQGHDRLPETIGGYRVVRRLAREATVDVLLALAEGARGDGRSVRLLLVSPPFRGDPAFEGTFTRETQALAQLDHACVVRLLDVFAGPDLKGLVLEHVEGVSLFDLKQSLAARGEALPDAAAFAVAAAVFAALAAGHAARDPQTGNLLPIVHRDVHPGQILVASDGTVKLAGFGLEKITGVRGEARAPEARAYLPPEKARGDAVTTRSDVYAAMLVTWELLARRRAVRDDALPEQELLRALTHPSIVSLDVLRPELPAVVRSIVSRALEPQVERRAVTAEEAASVFRSAASSEEGRRALAQAVQDLHAAPEPPAAAPSAPRVPSQPDPPASSPALSDRRPGGGAPRPNPRRMWGSSPTLTPVSPVIPQSSRTGSIPDARLSQDRGAGELGEPSFDPFRVDPPPPESRPLSSRTAAGGFDVAALNPLLEGKVEGSKIGEPKVTSIASMQAAAAATAPAPEAPLMSVPLSERPGIFDPDPVPAFKDAPLPPPPAGSPSGFWSAPPPPPPTKPTIRYAKRRGRSRSSITALGVGLFLIATAVGAGGFVWLFRKPPRPPLKTVATASSVATADIASSARVPPVPPSPPQPSTGAAPAAAPSATVAPPPTPSATSATSVAAAPVKPPEPPPAPTPSPKPAGGTEGTLRLDKRAAGHRVFVDGRVVGEGEGPYTVACGEHTVRVGGRGRSQKIDVPCGGEATAAGK